MSSFEILEGSTGLSVDDVAHVIVPGRGRSESGYGLSLSSEQRVTHAANFFIAQNLEAVEGVIVASGYKSPADIAGHPWVSTDADNVGEVFQGKPEAYSMRDLLLQFDIGSSAIIVEPHSIDTVTNFTRAESEGRFPDERPVAVVAQRPQLERILDGGIARKTLRREFLGVSVPEEGVSDRDNILALIVSRLVLLGIRPDTNNIAGITTSRVTKVWGLVNKIRAVTKLFDDYPLDIVRTTE